MCLRFSWQSEPKKCRTFARERRNIFVDQHGGSAWQRGNGERSDSRAPSQSKQVEQQGRRGLCLVLFSSVQVCKWQLWFDLCVNWGEFRGYYRN